MAIARAVSPLLVYDTFDGQTMGELEGRCVVCVRESSVRDKSDIHSLVGVIVSTHDCLSVSLVCVRLSLSTSHTPTPF